MAYFRLAFVALAIFTSSGCVNLYKNVDSTPDGDEESFHGIRDYLDGTQDELHVLQTHGMGDHPAKSYCADSGENIELQREIAQQLRYFPLATGKSFAEKPIIVDKTQVGTFSTHVYVDRLIDPQKTLYFSCLTWGDASRTIKLKMLELSPKTFLETNENENHRAYVNRQAKRFVNRSFSDPIIYSGTFGAFIRRGVWQGIQSIEVEQSDNRASIRTLSSNERLRERPSASFLSVVPMVVLSDSLGSRVLFDVLCTMGKVCGVGSESQPLQTEAESDRAEELANKAQKSIRSVFMFANQLPLLELAAVEPPPPNISLDDWLDSQHCLTPLVRGPGPSDDAITTIVALTDANDALSYHLSDRYKSRCSPPGSQLKIVNVTIPNAKLRILGLYSSLSKAHASGFKSNKKAIQYIVDGN